MYATWNLSLGVDGRYYDPSELLNSVGATMNTIFSSPAPETYLSQIAGDVTGLDLDQWDFQLLTKEQAIEYLQATFVPNTPQGLLIPPIQAGVVSLEDLISKINESQG